MSSSSSPRRKTKLSYLDKGVTLEHACSHRKTIRLAKYVMYFILGIRDIICGGMEYIYIYVCVCVCAFLEPRVCDRMI